MMCSHIRISTDLGIFASPRSFSQLITSFIGAMYQGILLYALCSLIFSKNCISNLRRIFTFFLDYTYSTIFLSWIVSYVLFVLTFYVLFFLVFLLFALMYFNLIKSFSIDIWHISLFISMQLSIYDAIATAIVDILRYLVGTSGLEPPTSRLSGVCSNQLSYVPVWNLVAHRSTVISPY